MKNRAIPIVALLFALIHLLPEVAKAQWMTMSSSDDSRKDPGIAPVGIGGTLMHKLQLEFNRNGNDLKTPKAILDFIRSLDPTATPANDTPTAFDSQAPTRIKIGNDFIQAASQPRFIIRTKDGYIGVDTRYEIDAEGEYQYHIGVEGATRDSQGRFVPSIIQSKNELKTGPHSRKAFTDGLCYTCHDGDKSTGKGFNVLFPPAPWSGFTAMNNLIAAAKAQLELDKNTDLGKDSFYREEKENDYHNHYERAVDEIARALGGSGTTKEQILKSLDGAMQSRSTPPDAIESNRIKLLKDYRDYYSKDGALIPPARRNEEFLADFLIRSSSANSPLPGNIPSPLSDGHFKIQGVPLDGDIQKTIKLNKFDDTLREDANTESRIQLCEDFAKRAGTSVSLVRKAMLFKVLLNLASDHDAPPRNFDQQKGIETSERIYNGLLLREIRSYKKLYPKNEFVHRSTVEPDRAPVVVIRDRSGITKKVIYKYRVLHYTLQEPVTTQPLPVTLNGLPPSVVYKDLVNGNAKYLATFEDTLGRNTPLEKSSKEVPGKPGLFVLSELMDESQVKEIEKNTFLNKDGTYSPEKTVFPLSILKPIPSGRPLANPFPTFGGWVRDPENPSNFLKKSVNDLLPHPRPEFPEVGVEELLTDPVILSQYLGMTESDAELLRGFSRDDVEEITKPLASGEDSPPFAALKKEGPEGVRELRLALRAALVKLYPARYKNNLNLPDDTSSFMAVPTPKEANAVANLQTGNAAVRALSRNPHGQSCLDCHGASGSAAFIDEFKKFESAAINSSGKSTKELSCNIANGSAMFIEDVKKLENAAMKPSSTPEDLVKEGSALWIKIRDRFTRGSHPEGGDAVKAALNIP